MIQKKRIWLEQAVKGKSLTHQKVADLSKIERSYFTQIVNGSRRPSPEVAKRIAGVLGFSKQWYRLLDDHEE